MVINGLNGGKMKALILNAGVGSRMGGLTDDKPKCLVEISAGETILGHQLKIFMKNGINNIIMTTGYCADKIKDYIALNFPELNIQYVHNPQYNSTNCIYSLFLTKDFIDDDIIFMTGDLVFDEVSFQKLLNLKEQNTVLINNSVEPPLTEFKGKIINGFIQKIHVNLLGDNCFWLLPIYKFSKESFQIWMKEVENFVKRGETNIFAEYAFNDISSQINLRPVCLNGNFCMEVDNVNDLEVVRTHLKNIGRN